MEDLVVGASFRINGVSGPDTDYFQFNVGEIIELEAHAVVRDRSGRIICDQVLTNTKSIIKTDTMPVADIRLSNSKSDINYQVELGSNPIRFIITEPCFVELTTTGYGCKEYIAEPVVAVARIKVLAPRLMGFVSNIAESPIIDRNVLEFSGAGRVGANNMTFTVNNSSDTKGCFGILHCYAAHSIATDVQGRRREIENHSSRAVRSFSDNDFIWNKVDIESSEVFSIGDGYKPGVYNLQ